jgi:hypothetical protein
MDNILLEILLKASRTYTSLLYPVQNHNCNSLQMCSTFDNNILSEDKKRMHGSSSPWLLGSLLLLMLPAIAIVYSYELDFIEQLQLGMLLLSTLLPHTTRCPCGRERRLRHLTHTTQS